MKTKLFLRKYFKFPFISPLFYCMMFVAIGVSVDQSWALEKHPPFSHYEVIEQRNIFKPVKKDIEAEKQPKSTSVKEEPPPPAETERYVLTGIISLRGAYKAIITDKKDGSGFYVSKGDTVGEFTVKKVKQDAVYLKKDGKTYELKLEAKVRKQKSRLLHKEPKEDISLDVQDELIDIDESYKTQIIQSIRKGIPNVKR